VSGSYPALRRLLFRLDAEHAHRLAIRAAELAEAALVHGPRFRALALDDAAWPREILGLRFPNPVGLAAGFDKNGVAPHLWQHLGFGFAELGTVTAQPQPGNPAPRMFRLPAERGIVNRLGFNNDGALVVAERLRRSLTRRPAIPIGLNIGCSKVAVGDEAAEIADYRFSARLLAPLADYLAINVSSPNTPGLRDLHEPARLERLVAALRAEVEASAGRPALLVKLSPDLADEQVPAICRAALAGGAAGFIASNTTLARPGCTSPAAGEAGGLSGAPLRARATRMVELVRAACGPGVPLIGVGGVFSAADVREKLAAGADLVALYSALVYEGPFLARRLVRTLGADRLSGRAPTGSA
jgi:dihydroorotate dehydrogenase